MKRRLGREVWVAICVGVFFVKGMVLKAEEFRLKYSTWNAPTTEVGKIEEKMLNMIEEKSGGRIKFERYYSESLLKMAETYRGVQTGIADMSYFGLGIPGSPARLGRVLTLPFMFRSSSQDKATLAMRKLWEVSPEIQNELKDVVPLGFRAMLFEDLHFKEKLVKVPQDVRGLKVLAVGLRIDYLKSLGAAPIAVGPGEWYLSLQRGLADGFYQHFAATYAFKIIELLKYHTILNINTGFDCFLVNKRVWDKLPQDLKEIIRDAVEWRTAQRWDEFEAQLAIDYAKKHGHTFYRPSDTEMQKWYESAIPMHQEWIQNLEKDGLPAKEIYERAKRIIESVEK